MFKNNNARVWACGVACVAWLAPFNSLAQNDADRLRLSALVQEGELLQQEAASLEPSSTRLRQDKQQLEAQEKALTAESAQVSESIKQFNVAAEQLNTSIAQQQVDCKPQMEDPAAVETCNARAAELRRQGERLQQLGSELDKRKSDVNERIIRHNQAGQEWTARNRENDVKLQPSQRDIKGWLARFTDFYLSDSFSAFTRRSGIPDACAQSIVAELDAMPPPAALRAAVLCLRSLRPERR